MLTSIARMYTNLCTILLLSNCLQLFPYVIQFLCVKNKYISIENYLYKWKNKFITDTTPEISTPMSANGKKNNSKIIDND